MIHSMTVRSNPRLILFGLLLLALPIFGIVLLITVSGVMGVAGFLVSGFLTYQSAAFMLPRIRGRIETNADGLTCTRPGGDLAVCWPEVTVAGMVYQKSEKPSIFVYSEKDDQLLIIPREFSDFDQLLACVQQHTSFQNVQLDATESLKDWLRQRLNITPDDPDESHEDHAAPHDETEAAL